MEHVVGLVLISACIVFIFGFGQAVGSVGSEYVLATLSGCVVLSCVIWFWGYFCGLPPTEKKEEEESD